jgi:hypothetical protein
MAAVKLPEPQDDTDRWLLEQIRHPGWAVVGIEASDEGPGYSFSVGVYHTLDQPEVVVMGLRQRDATLLINDVGERMRAGQRFAPGDRSDDLAEGYPTAFVGMDRRYYHEYLGYAHWLYRGWDFPAVQLVWPDKAGVFPWEPGYNARFFPHQRVLGPVAGWPHGWPFPAPPNQATFTSRQVVRDGRPIRLVTHDADDGSWQFLSGDPVTTADGMVVSLQAVLDRDPTVAELGNLPPGWRAVRADAGSPWERSGGEG